MADAGARLFIVGLSRATIGPQEHQKGRDGRNGADVREELQEARHSRPGDFIIGLPGETKESIRKTIDFAKELDSETIQVSIAHAYP